MEIHFQNQKPAPILAKLQNQLQNRRLGSMVTLEQHGNTLTITISKMGKSKLNFNITESSTKSGDYITKVSLVHKKISLTHRLLEKEVMAKFEKMITTAGGIIVSSYVV